MYDNSRLPSYMNAASRLCDTQLSRWSLDTPTAPITGATIGQSSVPRSTTTTLSSSFYFPPSQTVKQRNTTSYVNYYPSPPPHSASSSSQSSNYQRPKSTIVRDSTSIDPSSFHMNDLRYPHECKPVVGIVKPMVQQRSHIPFKHSSHHESKVPEMMASSYHASIHSLYSSSASPPLPPQPCATSSITYRSRPRHPQGNTNGQPPVVPRRHSSISNNNHRYVSSHRSSRTTSTSSSSIAAANEVSSTSSSHKNEHDDQNAVLVVDCKRLEMFYSSVGTIVKSSRSIARLFITTTRQLANFEDWSCEQTGVPLWIYNTGANLKRTRQVRLILAQHESCFALWSSAVSGQAELRLPKDNYITCWLPESNLLAVLKFERDDACRLFLRHYYEILEHERRMRVANSPPLPTGEIPSPSTNTKAATITNSKEIPRRYSRLRTMTNKQDKDQQRSAPVEARRCRSLSRVRTVKKSAISGPINFEHVNHVSGGCSQNRPLSGTMTLRSLHASMSHLPSSGTLTDRFSNQSQRRSSVLFEARTTAV